MAIDFPNSPTNGNTYTVGDRTWIYDGEKWNIQSVASSVIVTTLSDTAPDSPLTGRLWYESDTGATFVYNGSAWVEIGTSQGPYVCTSTTRPSSPYEGQLIYETDTNRILVYNASAWVMMVAADSPPGLELINTTSFSAQSTVVVDNCFTSTYAHYLITYNLTTNITGQYTALQLRASGTAKQQNYDRAGFYTTAGGASGADGFGTAQASFFLAGQSTGGVFGQLTVYNPQVSGRTGFTNMASYPGAYMSNGAQTETYSADGFQIIASGNAATHTGTVRTYGYRNSI